MTSYTTKFGKNEGYDLQAGNVYETNKPVTLYPRLANKTKYQIENCIGFKITEINKAGRRFTCEFHDAKKNIIITKRVYREYVEAMIDQLGLTPVTSQVESSENVAA